MSAEVDAEVPRARSVRQGWAPCAPAFVVAAGRPCPGLDTMESMTVHPIVIYGEPDLHRPAETVTEFDDALRTRIASAIRTRLSPRHVPDEVVEAPVYHEGPIQTVGRRKRAIARVTVVEGEGKIIVNGREFEDYFPNKVHQQLVKSPLVLVEREDGDRPRVADHLSDELVAVEGEGVAVDVPDLAVEDPLRGQDLGLLGPVGERLAHAPASW